MAAREFALPAASTLHLQTCGNHALEESEDVSDEEPGGHE